jgi:RNA polymerase sigma-70 factor (ECF subfamily)
LTRAEHLYGCAVLDVTLTDLLIRRAKRGDESARRALYDAHAARVYSTIRRIAGDDDAADDWSQEAWIHVFDALRTFRGASDISLWIHRIAVNSALYGLRRRARGWLRETDLEDAEHQAETSGRSYDAELLVATDVERGLSRLSEGMRTVLVLHDVDGYTHDGIASALAITVGTSKSQLFKARARLRALLGSDHRSEDSNVASGF